jgi:biopolymer transport protein ExbD
MRQLAHSKPAQNLRCPKDRTVPLELTGHHVVCMLPATKGDAMTLSRHPAKRGRVEIIPLIDTILILLIFYMSFSSFRGKEQQLEVPLPKFGGIAPPEIEVYVRGNDLLVNGVAFEPAVLQTMLATLRQSDARTAVRISADADAKYQMVIRAVDVCAQANVKRVSFRPLNG